MSGSLPEAGGFAVAGWWRLFRQDQLVGPGDAQAVLAPTMHDDDLAAVPEEGGAVDLGSGLFSE
jgi:hypothetical protein